MKKILFVTGTRADFGKLKPLINVVMNSDVYDYQIFATGMHMMAQYGSTVHEIERSGFKNIFTYINQVSGDDMEIVLANTVLGLSRYLHENTVDLIVVHGDRVEALAGATVGALRNIRVAHIEGGELSGTVDELMRHAISKLSHIHFVATEKARSRLIQLGEVPESVILIGSPDVDVMLSNTLPTIEEARSRYEIEFEKYALAIIHPVTTEFDQQKKNAQVFFEALKKSNFNYVMIYPNNDLGSQFIFSEMEEVSKNPRFKVFPSLRFEHFLTLLKNAHFLVGNSSAGIHEAPIYGVPTINIGTRQKNRFKYESIFDIPFEVESILSLISTFSDKKRYTPCSHYGDGTSAMKFAESLGLSFKLPQQKQFNEIG